MAERTATATILGYLYQFDNSIERILAADNDSDEITIEGIEDIDIKTANDDIAIQCKYYEKQEYNHSIIAEPIRLMLTHYRNTKHSKKIKYMLYGYFKSGQQKLNLPLDVEFLKSKFLTFTKNEITRYYHKELDLTDHELQEFLSLLEINICAKSYDEQYLNIINLLKKVFNCSDFEAENYYYNNALKLINKIAIDNDINNRKITKCIFLTAINSKQILFNLWYIQIKGKESYLKSIKAKLFSNGLNLSPFERFFIIEVPPDDYSRAEIKELLLIISNKYSKISKRNSDSFCPYVYLDKISEQELIDIKIELHNEGFIFVDGHDFHGAPFDPKAIIKKATYENQVKLKIINCMDYIEAILNDISKTKEIYHFFYKHELILNVNNGTKHIRLQIDRLLDVKNILQ